MKTGLRAICSYFEATTLQTTRLLSVLIILSFAPLQAEPEILQRIVLQEHLNHAWTNELVFFKTNDAVEKLHPEKLTLWDSRGNELPFQLDWTTAITRIALLTDLPPLSRKEFRLVRKMPRLKQASQIKLEQKQNLIRLFNASTGVEIPTSQGKINQGPVTAFRLKSGRWMGGSRLNLGRKIVSYEAKVVASGPLFGEVECLYRFEGDREWRIRFRVISDEPVVVINETFDLADKSRWELLVSPGFKPSHAFFRAATPNAPQKGSMNQNSVFKIRYGKDPTPLTLCSWIPWWAPGHACFLGLFRAEPNVRFVRERRGRVSGMWKVKIPDKKPSQGLLDVGEDEDKDFAKLVEEDSVKKDPALDDMFIAAAGRGADWARPRENGGSKKVPLKANAEGELFFSLQLAGPARSWIIGSVSAERAIVPDQKVSDPQRLMVKHCETSLDEVKDLILDWEAADISYPRLVFDRKELERLRKEERKVQDGDQRRRIIKQYLLTPDSEMGKKVAGAGRRAIDEGVKHFLEGSWQQPSHSAYTHHITMRVGRMIGAVDMLLGTDLLTPREKKATRSRIAFLGYKIHSPHFYSRSRGYSGNPNMTTSRNSVLGLLGCLIPKHPKAKEWAKAGLAEAGRELKHWSGPNGGWLEAPHYQTVSMAEILILAFAAKNAGFVDYVNDPRLARTILFLAKLSTPPDPALGGLRHFPPIGNTYLLETSSLFAIMAKIYRKKDPGLADQLQWAWKQQGSPPWIGIGGDYNIHHYSEFLYDDFEPSGPPGWKSELFPASGAVMRSGFPGNRETYLYTIQGPHHQHFDRDLGSITLWGKGRPLCLDWGYHGSMPAWQHSRVDIEGRPKIHTFVPQGSVDYQHGNQGGWDRQILFVKDEDPLGPNYFLIRDSTSPKNREANWWQWVNTAKHPRLAGDVVHAAGRDDVDLDIWFAPPLARAFKFLTAAEAAEHKAPELGDMELQEKKDETGIKEVVLTEEVEELKKPTSFIKTTDVTIPCYGGNGRGYWEMKKTTQKGLHLKLPPGGSLLFVLYPRLQSEAAASFESIADSQGLKMVSPHGTDYAFLSLKAIDFKSKNISFQGTAGSVQIRAKKVILTLSQPGMIRYQKFELRAGEATSKVFELE
ncbi:MAG: hypothetical protein QGG53_13690 [Planctomycetota bacterium]|nr:hypothetical protein [Planctomycetota bacterium]